MKCPRCSGSGSVPYHITGDLFDETNCPLCGGSGEVMTEQEYIQTATTEQLAEFLACVEARRNANYNEEVKAWVEWLKQPHSEKND